MKNLILLIIAVPGFFFSTELFALDDDDSDELEYERSVTVGATAFAFDMEEDDNQSFSSLGMQFSYTRYYNHYFALTTKFGVGLTPDLSMIAIVNPTIIIAGKELRKSILEPIAGFEVGYGVFYNKNPRYCPWTDSYEKKLSQRFFIGVNVSCCRVVKKFVINTLELHLRFVTTPRPDKFMEFTLGVDFLDVGFKF